MLVFLTWFGSYPGSDAIASTAPVDGLSATTAPPAPLIPDVEAIAFCRAWVATCWAWELIVSVTLFPSWGIPRS